MPSILQSIFKFAVLIVLVDGAHQKSLGGPHKLVVYNHRGLYSMLPISLVYKFRLIRDTQTHGKPKFIHMVSDQPCLFSTTANGLPSIDALFVENGMNKV